MSAAPPAGEVKSRKLQRRQIEAIECGPVTRLGSQGRYFLGVQVPESERGSGSGEGGDGGGRFLKKDDAVVAAGPTPMERMCGVRLRAEPSGPFIDKEREDETGQAAREG